MTALTERRRRALQRSLSRGHLSRPACSHVKQIAKRPGTRGPGGDIFRPGFLLAEGDPDVRVRDQETTAPKPASCMPARCARSSARPPRRCSSPRATSTTAPLQAERRFKNEEPGYQYSRFSNPTVTMFEQRMAALEGAEAARATATGMAAVTTALMGQVRAGDHVVAAKALFGSCRYVVEDHLPRYGVDLDAGRRHRSRRSGARRCGRTPRPSSWKARPIPTLEVLDIEAIAEIAHDAGATLVVDNVFSTPLFQQPLELGADCVVYSATKHIDGQGRCLGGVILASEKFIQDHVHNLIRQTGPSLSPFNAWVLLKGLETLAVRVQRQTDTAADGRGRAGRASQGHAADLSGPARPSAGRHHPPADDGRLDLVAFEVEGGKAGAFRFQDALKLVQDQQQSRRRQEPDHPSGDHDASAPDAGGARRARHQRRAGAALLRARARRRPDRGSADRAEGGVELRPVSDRRQRRFPLR